MDCNRNLHFPSFNLVPTLVEKDMQEFLALNETSVNLNHQTIENAHQL